MQSTPPALELLQHHSSSSPLKKRQKKQCSSTPKKTRDAGSSASSLSDLPVVLGQQEWSSPPRSLCPLREPLLIPGSKKGPLQLMVLSMLEVFQVARDLMAFPLPLTPKPLLVPGKETALASREKPMMRSPQWQHRSPEPWCTSPRSRLPQRRSLPSWHRSLRGAFLVPV